MSWGAVSASLILDYASRLGVYHQIDLDLGDPIYVFVDPEHLCCVPVKTSYYPAGSEHSNGSFHTVDHPSFTETREMLGRIGYIEIERGWSNGDRVLKPFFFNNVFKDVGEKFACASAMKYSHTELYNDGKPMFDLPNYKKEECQ
jgi:hypothetical protein